MISVDDLALRDLHSSLVRVYPVPPKRAEDTVVVLSHYRGAHTIKLLYSDGAAELSRSCNTMHICHEMSQPGVSQSNGIIEGTNQDVQIGTASCLLLAGRPTQLRTFAAPCYCMLVNVDYRRGV